MPIEKRGMVFYYQLDNPKEALYIVPVNNAFGKSGELTKPVKLDKEDSAVGPFPNEQLAETFSILLKSYLSKAQTAADAVTKAPGIDHQVRHLKRFKGNRG